VHDVSHHDFGAVELRCVSVSGDSLQILLVLRHLHIKVGDEMCADGICIESNEIEIDESAMTGESDMMKKASYKDSYAKLDKKFPGMKLGQKGDEGGHEKVPSPMLISGTRVQKGTGK
jgi:magnesium-transporting ATPase (P-type)